MNEKVPRPFEIALDIGHSSIGWAIFKNGEKFDLLGTGVVLFPADDCLASNGEQASAIIVVNAAMSGPRGRGSSG